ncbi:MAG: Kae1-associated serine/threonine protein kinase [Nanoarchaeota archaeon]|nr:Kae1-associated serine/threonine protein kinase [DPANN group archaeon]MBL7116370.1 Kae1-associated serine/threonine protein kinase [Nanoarchaeota archaeon]
MREIGSGAEAIIYLDNNKVVKKRIKKSYRIKEIDSTLRKTRTRTEAKILEKIPVKAPKLIETDREETLKMNFIKGDKIRDVLNKKPELAEEIGEKVAAIHNAGIIHGDLTTSNMILKNEIYFIDFGLSFFSEKIEDKAVDIHLFKQALESKHYKIWEKAFKYFLKGYNKAKNYKQIMERFKIVEARGRYKKK